VSAAPTLKILWPCTDIGSPEQHHLSSVIWVRAPNYRSQDMTDKQPTYEIDELRNRLLEARRFL